MSTTSRCLAILSPRRVLLAAVVTTVIMMLSPAFVDYAPLSEALHNSSSRLLPLLFQDDRSQAQRPTVDIVVSHYQENVTQLAEELNALRSLPAFEDVEVKTIIYTKGEDPDLAGIQAKTNASTVSKLPNTGRESGTYLEHIIFNWDNLARHTLFMQAEIHQPEDMFQRIKYNFHSHTGALPLNALGSCNCRDCSDPFQEENKYPRLAQLYSALNSELCPEQITLSYGGQMLVSAERIKQRRKQIYKHLKEILESDPDHRIHGDDRLDWRFGDEKSDPFFGHTMERSWMVLWNCSNTSVISACSQYEQFIQDGAPLDPKEPGWCQCLDG